MITEHRDAKRLYAKSNQFKTNFNSIPQSSEEKSLIFEIYRDNGEYLGICGALTYTETANSVEVVEWAISCRYFEIGLEEYIFVVHWANGKLQECTSSFYEERHKYKSARTN